MTRDYPKSPGPIKPPLKVAEGGPKPGNKPAKPESRDFDHIGNKTKEAQQNQKKT